MARQFSSSGSSPSFRDPRDRAFRRLGDQRRRLRRARRRLRRPLRDHERQRRQAEAPKTFSFHPQVYKAAVAAANGTASYEDYSEKVRELEAQSPISMRHVIGLKGRSRPDRRRRRRRLGRASRLPAGHLLDELRLAVGARLPRLRRGRQGDQLLCINGEGGEIQDMYGRYRKWRHEQVASRRFSVSAESASTPPTSPR